MYLCISAETVLTSVGILYVCNQMRLSLACCGWQIDNKWSQAKLKDVFKVYANSKSPDQPVYLQSLSKVFAHYIPYLL